jgi:hypothetical protein
MPPGASTHTGDHRSKTMSEDITMCETLRIVTVSIVIDFLVFEILVEASQLIIFLGRKVVISGHDGGNTSEEHRRRQND